MGLDGLRLLVATAIAGFAVAWPAYVHLWQRGGAKPLAWRTEPAQQRSLGPGLEVTRSGGVARALLTLGPRSSDGYGIDIVRVEEQRGRVVIVARERAPRSSERTRARVTFRAIVVVVPDREKPIAVEWQGR